MRCYRTLLSTVVFAVVGMSLLGSVEAQDAKKEAKKNDAVVPAPRKDKFWTDRHDKLVARSKQGNVDVLFIGDSITQGWEGAGKEVWAKVFDPMKAANIGISGDRTQHVLWRITEGKELEGISPKVAVMMIGTNNTSSNSAEEIAEGIKAIVAELKKARPGMKVLLLGVFPRSGKGNPKEAKVIAAADLQPKIKAINDIISKLDDGKTVHYMDIGGKFLNKEGGLSREIMPDFLHLSTKGYQIWAEAIKEKVEALKK